MRGESVWWWGGRAAHRQDDKTVDSLLSQSHQIQHRWLCGNAGCCLGGVLPLQVHRQQSTAPAQYCPSGQRSWCKFNRALANSEPSPPHSPTIHPYIVPPLKKDFEQLSHTTLMECCVLGATQNQNESLNSTIWQCCLKTELFCNHSRDCCQLSSNLLQLGPGSLLQTPGKVGGHCFSPHEAVPFWQGPSQDVCIMMKAERRRWRGGGRLYTWTGWHWRSTSGGGGRDGSRRF